MTTAEQLPRTDTLHHEPDEPSLHVDYGHFTGVHEDVPAMRWIFGHCDHGHRTVVKTHPDGATLCPDHGKAYGDD